jgi:aspartokinase-like uncharacterized kinase
MNRPVVVKVGGSLLSAENLVKRLQRWVAELARPVVFLTGGGTMVKTLRRQGIEADEIAHWAAIRIMQLRTHWLCQVYPGGKLVNTWAKTNSAWKQERQPFFQARSFLRSEESRADHLPHTWAVSSDSIAARLAARHDADLVLLKACRVTEGQYDWAELSRQGIVDEWFPQVAPTVAHIKLANLPE